MRDVNDPLARAAPRPGGALHFDVTRGASGATLIGALLDLGLDDGVVREALEAAGLKSFGLRVSEEARPEAAGLAVVVVDSGGRPLVPTAAARALGRSSSRASVRRRAQAPHKGVRKQPEAKAMGVAQGADDEGGAVLPFGDEGDGAPAKARVKGSVVVGEWAAGASARADDVLALVAGCALAPVAKAVAVKALRRLISARAATLKQAPGALALEGPRAVELCCEAVAFGALIEELSPARVTSTALLIDAAPDEWLDAVLEGVRVVEDDVGFAPTTPLGAALLSSLVHRFGPRGDVVVGRAGAGIGPGVVRGRPALSRALYGPIDDVKTRQGQPAGSARAVVEATVDDVVDRGALEGALAVAGASELVSWPVVAGAREARLRVSALVALGDVDAACRALYAHGASALSVLLAECRRPLRREVTVLVGRANKKEPVRLTEVCHEGDVLSVTPNRDDLVEASMKLHLPAETLRLDALAAYRDEHGARET